jgi:hypothetical protein
MYITIIIIYGTTGEAMWKVITRIQKALVNINISVTFLFIFIAKGFE